MRTLAREAHHPWPDGVYVQGGDEGLVVCRDGGTYWTAFVEVFTDGTFLRGEGVTVDAAEDDAWARFQAMRLCSAHPDHGPWERRGYSNGAAFCGTCGAWFPRRLPELPEGDLA